MALVRALENRRKMEEREKKRLEARAERIATKEKTRRTEEDGDGTDRTNQKAC